MSGNTALVQRMIDSGMLKTPQIIEAFETVDRCHFVPEDLKEICYIDKPLPIGEEQTISQPSTVAFMLELLSPQRGDKILDIGSGSGWTTALLCHIVGQEGSVLGLERREMLVEQGIFHLRQFGYAGNCSIEKAGRELGIPGEKFDRILVSASARRLRESLLDQLYPGGVLVIPVRNDIIKIEKIDNENYLKESYHGFVFVPLIIESEQ